MIGCSGSFPGPDSPASCYLVETERDGRIWRILLDLGSGAIGVLQRHLDPMVVDAVLLSHLHPDHCMDLCGYYVLRKYHPTGAPDRIPVFGPEGTAARMAQAYGLPADPGMGEEFDFATFPADGFQVGPFAIRAVRIDHPVPGFAIRVESGGRVLTYSGDTGPCAGLDRAAEGAHLLLCEAAFRETSDNPVGIHLTGRQAGEAAARASVGRLVLTHVPPWHDRGVALEEALTAYDGPVELAATGAVFDV